VPPDVAAERLALARRWPGREGWICFSVEQQGLDPLGAGLRAAACPG
jgi:hypothetical protein